MKKYLMFYILVCTIVPSSAYVLNNLYMEAKAQYLLESKCVAKLISYGHPRASIETSQGTCHLR